MTVRVKIGWVDFNPSGSGFKIYKNSSIFTKDTKPTTAIAELTVDAREYIDLDVTEGSGYWYMVEFSAGSTTTYSEVVYHIATDDGVVL